MAVCCDVYIVWSPFRQQMSINIVVFYVMTPCSLVSRYQHFGGIYYLHLQGRNDLIFTFKMEFLRNVGTHLSQYRILGYDAV
jgi:hypothetical protein